MDYDHIARRSCLALEEKVAELEDATSKIKQKIEITEDKIKEAVKMNNKQEKELHDILERIEEIIYALKDGKQIVAHQKILGIKQKIAVLYSDSKNENNKDK